MGREDAGAGVGEGWNMGSSESVARVGGWKKGWNMGSSESVARVGGWNMGCSESRRRL